MDYTSHTVESLFKELTDLKTYQAAKFAELEAKEAQKGGLLRKDGLSNFVEKKAILPYRPQFLEEGLLENTEHKSHFLHYLRKGSEEVLRNYESKALSTTTDPEGGFLVPEELSNKIIQTLKLTSPLRDLATVVSISTDALEMLVDKGEANVGWTQELGERQDTDTPELARLRIPVHEMYARPYEGKPTLSPVRTCGRRDCR